MKLIQAILPFSKVQDGPDNIITSNPDKNGGFELGTWDHVPWGNIIKEYNIRKVGECSYGVQCCHKFSKEECEKIVEYLKTWKVEYYKGKKGYMSPDNKCGWYKEYYNIFIKIFENHDDLPVYYFAG